MRRGAGCCLRVPGTADDRDRSVSTLGDPGGWVVLELFEDYPLEQLQQTIEEHDKVDYTFPDWVVEEPIYPEVYLQHFFDGSALRQAWFTGHVDIGSGSPLGDSLILEQYPDITYTMTLRSTFRGSCLCFDLKDLVTTRERSAARSYTRWTCRPSHNRPTARQGSRTRVHWEWRGNKIGSKNPNGSCLVLFRSETVNVLEFTKKLAKPFSEEELTSKLEQLAWTWNQTLPYVPYAQRHNSWMEDMGRFHFPHPDDKRPTLQRNPFMQPAIGTAIARENSLRSMSMTPFTTR